ncbi:5-deoxy-glucuronate isomerase [Gulosibacter sp. 10]|uniref:5-deoxy-glucuronate isomerase n=1 Tax=Gulosibacter sp. 10 TaxID=1255570 RepID=UPI00097F1B5B|nr:5-deoxy-glucuronate isomerase [Gulosibacter sp. 10]SJM55345.1 5-deoxy-glucuronate isomerase [Gulosibacter sp. 10]
MTQNEWFFKRGELAQGDWQSVVDGERDGWQHTGLRVAELTGAERLELAAGDVERIIIPLAGGPFQVEWSDADDQGQTQRLDGRPGVFDGPTDVFYLGAGGSAVLSGTGRVAVAEAPTTQRFPACYIAKEDVPVELRGTGRASRQVHNFGTPAALEASKFIVCEVITPAENWSSFPAHKHDELVPGTEMPLEEIYYFETAVTKGAEELAPENADPFALFATYPSQAGDIHINAIVRTGDVALVPYGYHGPAAAAPGYDLYYLNVMAGPAEERKWIVTDDPAHGWIRETWEGQELDSRLPYGDE